MKTIGPTIRWMLCFGVLVGAGWCSAMAAAEAADAETATYEDWTVRCVQRREPAPRCDIVQAIHQKETGRTIMQVSVAYAPEQDRYAVQFLLPLGIMIQPGVSIRIDEKTEIKDYPITRCAAQGCFVEKLVESKDLAPFRTGKSGVVSVAAAPNGQVLSIPVSFNGFETALNEMARRNKTAATAKRQ